MCISDIEKSNAANVSAQPTEMKSRGDVDHFDSDVTLPEKLQPTDSKDGDDNRPSVDKERIHFRRKDAEKGREESPTPVYDRKSQDQSDDKVERLTPPSDVNGGLKDGDGHRTRRKEMADEVEDKPLPPPLEADRKTYQSTTFESTETDDGDRGSRKDEGRGTLQYSRQDRRKNSTLLTYCFVTSEADLLSLKLQKLTSHCTVNCQR